MDPAHQIGTCGLVVRPHEHVVSVEGRDLDLTMREFEIVSRLAEHPGWVLSAEQLSVEDVESDYSPESVSVLVSRLRRKLAGAGAPDAVETVRGIGYRLHVSPCEGEEHSDTDPREQSSLRDASWCLQEAVLEVEHSGTDKQRQAAADALDDARRAIYEVLAQARR